MRQIYWSLALALSCALTTNASAFNFKVGDVSPVWEENSELPKLRGFKIDKQAGKLISNYVTAPSSESLSCGVDDTCVITFADAIPLKSKNEQTKWGRALLRKNEGPLEIYLGEVLSKDLFVSLGGDLARKEVQKLNSGEVSCVFKRVMAPSINRPFRAKCYVSVDADGNFVD